MAFAGFIAKCVLKTTVESDTGIECRVDLLLQCGDRADGPKVELWLSPEDALHFAPGVSYALPFQPVTPS